MKSFLKVMKALSDPNRVKIIKLLQQKMMCVCELQGALNIAQPTVSKHLKILEEAGLVDFAELLLRAHELWLNHPTLLDHYRKRLNHLLVDEFQDTDPC